MRMRTRILGVLAAGGAALTLVVAGGLATAADASGHGITFSMVRSAASEAAGPNCLPNAQATVRVTSHRLTETMNLHATGLPPNTNFDLFITQVPNGPFGVSWYQSDLRSNPAGVASVTVTGRFNIETFAVAPNTAPAPVVHPADAASNPPFAPIHTYHVGFWFDSSAEATAAHCSAGTTPFNGDHTAGVQAMSTRNFPTLAGPLRQLGS